MAREIQGAWGSGLQEPQPCGAAQSSRGAPEASQGPAAGPYLQELFGLEEADDAGEDPFETMANQMLQALASQQHPSQSPASAENLDMLFKLMMLKKLMATSDSDTSGFGGAGDRTGIARTIRSFNQLKGRLRLRPLPFIKDYISTVEE